MLENSRATSFRNLQLFDKHNRNGRPLNWRPNQDGGGNYRAIMTSQITFRGKFLFQNRDFLRPQTAIDFQMFFVLATCYFGGYLLNAQVFKQFN